MCFPTLRVDLPLPMGGVWVLHTAILTLMYTLPRTAEYRYTSTTAPHSFSRTHVPSRGSIFALPIVSSRV